MSLLLNRFGQLALLCFALSAGFALADDAPATDAEKGDKADAPMAEEEKPAPDPFAVPDGDSKQLMEFIETVQKTPIRTREDFMKRQTALQTAARRIIDMGEKADAKALTAAQRIDFQGRVNGLYGKSPEEVKEFIGELTTFVDSQGTETTIQDYSLVSSAGRMLERADRAEAIAMYENFGKLFSTSSDQRVAAAAEKFAGTIRRLHLPETPMELSGKTVDGKDFNLESMRGKVVLVDFWATWCGPCVAEFPNVKENYEKYHDHGFEIVGVSLDSKRDKLEEFIADRGVEWTTLYEDGAGWKNTLAGQYGINAIPTVILLDREGKAISLNARGEELGKILEEQLGPIEDDKQAAVEE